MKLENWLDLFKVSKELLDDDYNPGQALVAKTKSKSEEGASVSLCLIILLGSKHHYKVRHF